MSTFFPLYLLVIILTVLFHSIRPCVVQFIPKEGQNHDRGDYGFKHFKSQRNKILDCTCGTVPPVSDPPSQFQFPWEVLITHTSGKVCRGTIINDRIILTTASCVMNVSLAELMNDPSKPLIFPQSYLPQPNELKIWTTYEGITGTVGMEVIDIYTNPLYLSTKVLLNKVDYDIALLTLKNPLSFENGSKYAPVCLPHFPQRAGETDLEGLDTILTRWHMPDPNNFTNITEDSTFYSLFFPRMNCRISSGNSWISDRFLCTMAPNFTAKVFTEIGGAVMIRNYDQYSQVGIHSWRTYFPLLYHKHPLSLASNVIGFMEKIEKYSARMNANWCKNDWNGLPKKDGDYEIELKNLQEDMPEDPWNRITSDFRDIRRNCKCGIVNSNAAKGRIQGGVDTAPYKYGWQVLLLARFDAKWEQLCGGAIINNRIVVTAAHCVLKFEENSDKGDLVKPENMRVYLHRYKGPTERDDLSRIAEVIAVIPHPYFKIHNLVENDIALIVLRRRICFKCLKGKVSPLCFPETDELIELDNRTDAKIIGWGRTDILEPGSHSEKLQESPAIIISRRGCMRILRHHPHDYFLKQIKDDDKKMCAGKFTPARNYSDPAHGDSGGPLFLPVTSGSNTFIHVGIASMVSMSPDAIEHDDPKTVTFYTKTQSYLDFVDYYSAVVDAEWCSR